MILTHDLSRRRPLTPPSFEPWLHIYPDASNGYAVDLNATTYAIFTASQAEAVREAGTINAAAKFPLRGRGRDSETISGRALASALDYLRANFDYDTPEGRKRVIINELMGIVLASHWRTGMTIADFWRTMDARPEAQPGGAKAISGWDAAAEVRKALESKSLDFLEKKLKKEQKKS